VNPTLRLEILAFTAVRVVFSTLQRMVYPFLAVFALGLNVSQGQFSAALALRAASGVLGPFIATIADSRGRKVGMLVGLGLYILGVTAILIWPIFPVFVGTMILTSLGYLTFIPSMQAYLGDQVPYRLRGRALGLTELGWSLSFIVGTYGASFLLANWGWRSPFPFLLGFSLFFLLIFLRWLPSDHLKAPRTTSSLGSLRHVFLNPLALVALSMSFTLAAANESVNLIFGIWLEAGYALQITQLGLAALAIGITELVGEGLSAAFADPLGKSRSVAIGLALNILAALFLVILGGSLAGAMIALLFFYLTFEFTLVSSLPLLTEIIPQARASFMAANIAAVSLGRAGGALLSTWLYNEGIRLALPSISLNTAAAVLLNSLSLISLFILWKGMRHVES
jgi:predicted MFS family arabinose efflux permease